MSLPQRNGTLVKVTGPSSGESYDGPGVAGPDKWLPAVDEVADVYLRETRDRVETAAGSDRTIDRVLVVDAAVDVDWRSGDVVTWRPTGAAVDEVATVRLVQTPEIDDPEITDDMRGARLTLETA